MLALSALFGSALIAATLVPAQSEAVLVALILNSDWPVWLLLAIATTGNILGSTINWLVGRFLCQFRDRSWFPVRGDRLERSTYWYHRWGHWSLLLSWLPIVGDPLTLVAGLLHEPLWRFLGIVTLAKAGRYSVLAWATLTLAG